MGKLIFTLQQVLRPELIAKGLISIIGISSFYLLFNDHSLLYFIPIETKGLLPVGRVVAAKGIVMRKLISDSLQLPIGKNDKLYEDDLLTTGDTSTAEIELKTGYKLTTEPNTILRLRNQNNHLTLHLQQGSVISNFANDEWVTLKLGMRNQQIQIRKGTYFIKNSYGGIQITAYSSQHTVKRGVASTNRTKEVKSHADVEGPNEPQDNKELIDEKEADAAEELQAIKEEEKANTPTQFPQPEDKLIYLLQSPQSIRLVARPICEIQCEIKVFRNREFLKNKLFTKGQVPVYELTIDEIIPTQFQWSFTDGTETENFEFQIAPFSIDEFKKYLDQGLNVEIL